MSVKKDNNKHHKNVNQKLDDNFVKFPCCLLQQDNMNYSTMILYAKLMQVENQYNPSQQYLSDQLGQSLITTKRQLKILKDKKFIEYSRPKLGRNSNKEVSFIQKYLDNEFIPIPDWILSMKMSSISKLLYGNLYRYFLINGEVFPSIKRLAQDLNTSKRQINYSISELKQNNLLEVITNGGIRKTSKNFRTNVYRLKKSIGETFSALIGETFSALIGETFSARDNIGYDNIGYEKRNPKKDYFKSFSCEKPTQQGGTMKRVRRRKNSQKNSSMREKVQAKAQAKAPKSPRRSKKEIDSYMMDDRVKKVMEAWNNQSLLKTHRGLTKLETKLAKEAHKKIKLLLEGKLIQIVASTNGVPPEWYSSKWSVEDIIEAIENLNEKCKEGVEPRNPKSKEFLRKLSLPDAIYCVPQNGTPNSPLMTAYKGVKKTFDPMSKLSTQESRNAYHIMEDFFKWHRNTDDLDDRTKQQIIHVVRMLKNERKKYANNWPAPSGLHLAPTVDALVGDIILFITNDKLPQHRIGLGLHFDKKLAGNLSPMGLIPGKYLFEEFARTLMEVHDAHPIRGYEFQDDDDVMEDINEVSFHTTMRDPDADLERAFRNGDI